MNGPPEPPAGIPPWLGWAIHVISTLGISTLFAVLLLWFTLTRFDRTVEVIQHNEEARTKLLVDLGAQFVAASERQSDRFDRAIEENIRANRTFLETILLGRRAAPPVPAAPPP